MTKKSKKAKVFTYKGYTCKLVDKWKVPESGGAPILTMPNIPHPLHNQNPRMILGKSTWDHMRNRCYYESKYACEICGEKVKTEFYDDGSIHHKYNDDGTIPKRSLHAHEMYDIDYNKGTATFVRAIAACEKCHVRFIHSGRMLTMYEKGDPLMTADKVLEGLEHGFKLIKEWNDNHKGGEKLRVFFAVIDFTTDPTIGEQVKELIDKYDIEFYAPDGEKMPNGNPAWGEWKLIIGEKEYITPFKSQKDWEKAMEKNNAEQLEAKRTWMARFKKYDSLDAVKITDEDMEKVNRAEVPEDF